MNYSTIVYLVDESTGKVILAKKGRKVGKGKWFGYGGKREGFETAEQCACRETKDECGVEIDPKDLEPFCEIHFYRGTEQECPFGSPIFRMVGYRARRWEGTPVRSDEMENPTSFPLTQPPWDDMKPGDELFVPHIIMGFPVRGWIRFANDDSQRLLDSNVRACSKEDFVFFS